MPVSGEGAGRLSLVYHRRLKVIDGIVWRSSDLRKSDGFDRNWIWSSVEIICESCFQLCKSLGSISFESDSKMSRIDWDGFRGSGLRSIHFPASVEVIHELAFSSCTLLLSIIFESDSKLSRIGREAFWGSGLRSIHFPPEGCKLRKRARSSR
jgi:hypothetical protein